MSANPETFDRYDLFPIPAYCLCTCTRLSDQVNQECAEDMMSIYLAPVVLAYPLPAHMPRSVLFKYLLRSRYLITMN